MASDVGTLATKLIGEKGIADGKEKSAIGNRESEWGRDMTDQELRFAHICLTANR